MRPGRDFILAVVNGNPSGVRQPTGRDSRSTLTPPEGGAGRDSVYRSFKCAHNVRDSSTAPGSLFRARGRQCVLTGPRPPKCNLSEVGRSPAPQGDDTMGDRQVSLPGTSDMRQEATSSPPMLLQPQRPPTWNISSHAPSRTPESHIMRVRDPTQERSKRPTPS